MLVREKDLGVNLKDTVYAFSLEDIGVNRDAFNQEIKPSFDALAWDHYELKRRQVDFLKSVFTFEDKDAILEAFLVDYYEDKHDEKQLQGFLKLLSTEELEEFQAIQPRRKRAIGYFSAVKTDNGVEIKVEPFRPFTQEASSYYPKERFFKELSEEIKSSASIHTILTHFTSIMFQEHPEKHAIDICMHQTHSLCFPNHEGSGAPEGIHQDGMDYIISALVIERNNIRGGTSKLYYPGGLIENEIYSKTLVEGEGIFQADDQTEIWHDVTPIKPADNTQAGYRNTIGFDFKFV